MKTQRGCFVYRVLPITGSGEKNTGIAVRSSPTTKDSRKLKQLKIAQANNLVCIDEIRIDQHDNRNKFLKLADGSGWLFEAKNQKGSSSGVGKLMEPVPVELGLWTFYVDNFKNNNAGIRLRNHPIDETSTPTTLQTFTFPEENKEKTLLPMQKIYCDRKVVIVFDPLHHGGSTCNNASGNEVTFYRLQGTKSSWVFDKRIHPETGKETTMLIPEHNMMRTGKHLSFAFRNVAPSPIATRFYPDIRDSSKIQKSNVKTGEVVVCNAIRSAITQYPNSSKNGPFLRLTNGMGWLFVYKRGAKLMEEVSIDKGTWSFKIVNAVGICLRRQPIDSSLPHNKFDDTVYSKGTVITCDRRILPSSTGMTTFYRVQGTQGWVFDKREGGSNATAVIMMEPSNKISSSRPKKIARLVTATTPGWTPDFVRGVASAVVGGRRLTEIAYHDKTRMISFSSSSSTDKNNNSGNSSSSASTTQINVYCTTRTIGTILMPQTNQSNNHNNNNTEKTMELFRRDCTNVELSEILRDPRIHMNQRYEEMRENCTSKRAKERMKNSGVEVNVEEEMRISFIECEQQQQQQNLANHQFQQHRKSQLLASILERDSRHYQEAKEAKDQVERLSKAIAQRIATEKLKARTCSYCKRVFTKVNACQNHEKDVHGGDFKCKTCSKIFAKSKALYQHRKATGH